MKGGRWEEASELPRSMTILSAEVLDLRGQTFEYYMEDSSVKPRNPRFNISCTLEVIHIFLMLPHKRKLEPDCP